MGGDEWDMLPGDLSTTAAVMNAYLSADLIVIPFLLFDSGGITFSWLSSSWKAAGVFSISNSSG